MSNYLNALHCRIFGHPAYRRARKGENPDMKYCVRCGDPKAISKRARRTSSPHWEKAGS